MDIDQLRTFLLVAELRSFTQAARRLNFSQSAISQQIRELEDRQGVRLFERHSRSVSLTPAGERLRPLARTILRDVEAAQEALGEFRGTPQGVLRLGASHTAGIYLMPYLLGQFTERYPGVKATLMVADGELLNRAMQEGELDLALVEESLMSGRVFGWEKRPVLQDELVLVSQPGRPWVKMLPAPMSILETVPMILRQESSTTRALIWDALAESGFNPNQMRIRFEVGNTEGIKRAVMAGLGLGWVSRYAITNEVKMGALFEVPVEGVRIWRQLCLATPTKPLSAQQQSFAALFDDLNWLPVPMRDFAQLPEPVPQAR